MELELKDTREKFTINGTDFYVDLGDALVLDAEDKIVKIMRSVDDDTEAYSVEDVHDHQLDFLRVAFGEEQISRIEEIKPLNYTNASILCTAVIAAIANHVTTNGYEAILSELGIAAKTNE